MLWSSQLTPVELEIAGRGGPGLAGIGGPGRGAGPGRGGGAGPDG